MLKIKASLWGNTWDISGSTRLHNYNIDILEVVRTLDNAGKEVFYYILEVIGTLADVEFCRRFTFSESCCGSLVYNKSMYPPRP